MIKYGSNWFCEAFAPLTQNSSLWHGSVFACLIREREVIRQLRVIGDADFLSTDYTDLSIDYTEHIRLNIIYQPQYWTAVRYCGFFVPLSAQTKPPCPPQGGSGLRKHTTL